MKIKINFPSEQSGIEILNRGVEEFKATLYIESIANLTLARKQKSDSKKFDY